MTKKLMNKKEIIISVFVLLGAVAFTVASFCIYYLVKPQNAVILVVICLADFAYNLFSLCMLLKYAISTNKWLLKGFLFAVGYIVAFIIIAILFLFFIGLVSLGFNGSIEFIKNNVLGIVFYAFFTGPCVLIIVPLLLVGLAYA